MSQEYSQAYVTQNSEVLETTSSTSNRTNVTKTTSLGASTPTPKSIKKSVIKKNSFVLTSTDSIKLNLLTQPTGVNYYFKNNVLTQTITPITELNNKDLYVWVDSLNCLKSREEILKNDSIKSATSQVNLTDSITVSLDSLTIATPIQTEKKSPKKNETTIYTVKDHKVNPTSAFHDSKLFLLIIVLFSLGLLGYLRIKSSRFLRTIFKGLFSYHESKKLFTTVNIRNSIHSVVLDLLFSINMGILIYEIASITTTVNGYFYSLAVFVGAVVAVSLYFILKNLLYRLVGYAFYTSEDTNEYIFFAGVINKTYGIIITPILIILPFTTGTTTYITIAAALLMYGFLYLIQLVRALKIIFKKASSLFYYILYLCTLEILPFVIMYRILTR